MQPMRVTAVSAVCITGCCFPKGAGGTAEGIIQHLVAIFRQNHNYILHNKNKSEKRNNFKTFTLLFFSFKSNLRLYTYDMAIADLGKKIRICYGGQ